MDDLFLTRDYSQVSAIDIAAAVGRRQVSAVEVVDTALRRIAALDCELRAFTEVWAAWCGAMGLKLTNGRLPARDRAGLNAPGIVAWHASDLAAYVEVVAAVAGPHPVRAPLRVAWSPDLGYADTEPEIADVARTALAAFDFLDVAPIHVGLRDPRHAWQALRHDDPDPATVELRADNDQRLRDLFERVDLLATPTTPNPPHGLNGPGAAMSVALTWTFNLGGQPAISLPAGCTASGAPVGLQFVAPHLREDLLLAVANCDERSPTRRANSDE